MRVGRGVEKESVTGRDGARRVLSPQSFRRKEMEDWTDRMTDSCCEGIIEGCILCKCVNAWQLS